MRTNSRRARQNDRKEHDGDIKGDEREMGKKEGRRNAAANFFSLSTPKPAAHFGQ